MEKNNVYVTTHSNGFVEVNYVKLFDNLVEMSDAINNTQYHQSRYFNGGLPKVSSALEKLIEVVARII